MKEVRTMYGSIHTHFESEKDTGNDKKAMVNNFIKIGAKKVAVTEHGVFSSYEDLRDIVKKLKANAKKAQEKDPNVKIPDFDIIPGIEGYLGDNAAHLILVAKDYQGYLSLCKIITESNKNVQGGKGSKKPIITLENLKENVNKGHLFCTSACIGGPFGHLLGLDEYRLKEKIDKLTSELETSHFTENADFIRHYESEKARYKEVHPTKTAMTKAIRVMKKTGDDSEYLELTRRDEIANEIIAWLEGNKPKYDDCNKFMKGLGKTKAKFSRKQTTLEKTKEEYEELLSKKENGELESEAHYLLEDFIDIFGEDNFYFEIQNHGMDIEKEVYNNVISFAYREDFPHFIASNDIHVGLQKSDPDYERMLLRRNVIKFTRFNQYEPETPDERELTIKDDDELKEELLKSISDVQVNGQVIKAEDIIDSAIANIEHSLDDCEIEFPKNENHYPKFCDDENAEFERLVREGIKNRFPNGFPDERYQKRLEYELGVITKMGYAGYHLIVADYLNYGRRLGYLKTKEEIDNAPLSIEELDKYIDDHGYKRIGYSIGPGRGSAVGSLCCYLMGITDIDPIPYNLLFERFLNVERVSMPKQYWAFGVNPITQGCVA